MLALLVFVSGFGCKGLSTEEQQLVRPVRLEYWTVHNDTSMLRQFAAEYQQIFPYVTINIKQVRSEEFENLFVNALADDVAPDMISIHADWIRQYANRLAPVPSTIEVARYSEQGTYSKEVVVTKQTIQMPTIRSVQENFVRTVAEDAVVGGQLYGFPLAMDTLALYYNKTLLDRAGIPLPPQTWDEFLRAVQQTTRFNSRGDIVQSGVALGTGETIDHSFDLMSMLMMQNGITMAQGSTVTFSSGISERNTDVHPAMQALRFYTDFARDTKDVYSWNNDLGNAFDHFVRGKSVFYFGYAHDMERIEGRAPQLDVEVTTLPQLNPQVPANVANYWIEGVVKKSASQNHAWNFIRYISSPSNISKYVAATNQPTPLRVGLTEQMDDPFLEPFASQVLHATHWYQGRNISAAKEAMNDMVENYRIPYATDVDPGKRDAQLLANTARIIQQTY